MTTDEQNKQMVLKLQKDPEALKQVKDEMAQLQELGFIVKLKDLPESTQKKLNEDFKQYIPTTIAFNAQDKIFWPRWLNVRAETDKIKKL